MVVLRVLLDVLLLSAGGLFALFGIYLAALAFAALVGTRRRKPVERGAPSSRVTVLVPAYNEADSITRCVASLRTQTYPESLTDVVVVADNCTDDTAAVAAAAGARVLDRDEPSRRGKGQALAWAMTQILAEDRPPDAIVVVDADSIAVPELLERLVHVFERGAPVVQGESLLELDDEAPSLRAVAMLLINRVRPAGRALFGLPCSLAGNGMLFGRDLLRAHPWNAFSSVEDAEYELSLRAQGIRPAFAKGAIVRSGNAPNAAAAERQQLRWEGGKLYLARRFLPGLTASAIRTRDPWLLDAAWELAVPPLGFVAVPAAAGTAAAAALAWAGLVDAWAVAPFLVALVSVPVFVLVGLVAARAPAAAYRALIGAPAFLVRKVLRARGLLRYRVDDWTRTERAGESASDRG